MNENEMKASEKEVGGKHYKGTKMQPLDLIARCDLNFFQGNIIKYVTRHSQKNGYEDLKKAYHYALLGKEYNPYNVCMERPVYKKMEAADEYAEINKIPKALVYDVVDQDWDDACEIIKQMSVEHYGKLIEL